MPRVGSIGNSHRLYAAVHVVRAVAAVNVQVYVPRCDVLAFNYFYSTGRVRLSSAIRPYSQST